MSGRSDLDQGTEHPRPVPVDGAPDRTFGLVDEGASAVRRRLAVSWDAFLSSAEAVELDAPSRLAGWSGRDILAHLGEWPGHHPLEATVESARTGRLEGLPDQDDVDAEMRRLYAQRPRSDLLSALEGARASTLAWFDSAEPETIGLRPAATIVGPLPLLTAIQCLCFELATHAMDLEVCGAPPSDANALDEGLAAICDATAGIAHRVESYTSVTIQTPDGGWHMSIREQGWTTQHRPPGPLSSTGVFGRTRDLLDVAAGRANVPALYATGRIKVVDLPGFLELAPLIDHMPGIPNRAALRAAAGRLRTISGLLRRRRTPPRG